MLSIDLETGARTSQSTTEPSLVPAANSRARCPGTSAGLAVGSEPDIGVKDGEDAFERPEKLSSGSSDVVCVANADVSIVVDVISTFFRPPRENFEVRHSSVIGRGVMDPVKSSCVSESSRRSNEKVGVGESTGEAVPPKREGGVPDCVLPEVKGGVVVVLLTGLSWKRVRLYRLTEETLSSSMPQSNTNTCSPALLPSSPAKSTSSFLRMSHPEQER